MVAVVFFGHPQPHPTNLLLRWGPITGHISHEVYGNT